MRCRNDGLKALRQITRAGHAGVNQEPPRSVRLGSTGGWVMTPFAEAGNPGCQTR